MEDRVDAFARLKRLHTEGVLSDEEYEREKAKLMGRDPAERKASWAERWAIGQEFGKGLRGSMRLWFIASVAVILLIGTYFFGKAASLAESRGELAGAAPEDEGGGGLFAADSPWEVQTSTDPMTDATVTQAVAAFEGSQFNVEVSVSCSSTGDIAYTATSFDKDGKPAEMRVTAIPPSVIGAPAGSQSITVPRVTPGRLTIGFQMRADNNPFLSWSTTNPQYNNQVVLESAPVQPLFEDGSGGDHAEQMASASKVVLRLFMGAGEETIEWPQTEPSFRDVVGPCLEQRQATRTKLTRERDEELQRREQEYNERVQRMGDDANAVSAM